MIRRLAIIGVGLIGGSLARALRQAGFCASIAGYGRHRATLQRARELGVIDEIADSIPDAVHGADMVVVATPLGAMDATFEAMRGHLDQDAVLTDVGSAKSSVVRSVAAVFGDLPSGFVPAHPIAGTERSGVEASFAELFRDRRVIITPTAQSDAGAVQRVTEMWEVTGAEVVEMSAEHHDQVLAATSHLPHLLAFGLVDTLARLEDRMEIFRYAAGGFRDFTRIASSNPTMWHDICMANRDGILPMLARFEDDLRYIARAIENGDSAGLMAVFERAKAARDQFVG